MLELYAACGEWKLDDNLKWVFTVDTSKGSSLCEIDESITYKDLVVIVAEDFGVDVASISLSYELPVRLKSIVEDSPPIYLRNDRQVRTLIKKIQEEHELIRLCVKVSDKCNSPVAVEISDVDKRHVFRVSDGDSYVNESNVRTQRHELHRSICCENSVCVAHYNDANSTAEMSSHQSLLRVEIVGSKTVHTKHISDMGKGPTLPLSNGDSYRNNVDCEIGKHQRTYVVHNNGSSSANIFSMHSNQQELHQSVSASLYAETSSTSNMGSHPYLVHPAADPGPFPIGYSYSTREGDDDIYVNRVFSNKDELMEKMNRWVLRWKFEFKCPWSDSKRVMLRCVDKSCSWRMRATRASDSDGYMVTKYVHEHTCDTTHRNANHRQATAKTIGTMICGNYGEKKDGLKPKQIIELVRQEHGAQITYKKAWRAKGYGELLMRGYAEESYHKVAKWLFMAKEKNPGSEVYLEVDKAGTFKYGFVAFGPSLRGFGLMRRVIAIDGTFLKAKFKGTLLVATAQDGDFHLYPLAFAIVDSENDASWNWFLLCLRSAIPDASDLVFVSDRAPSISKALSQVYPSAHHGICRVHLPKNLKPKYGQYLKLVEAAANAYSTQEFNAIFETIRRQSQSLAEVLENAVFSKWARSHAPTTRYNMMTSNIAESMNSALNDARELPIVSLLESIRLTLSTWFHERRVKASKHTKRLTPNVVSMMIARFEDPSKLDVYQVDENEFEVKDEIRKFVVDLKKKECTCCVFNIDQIPCVHAIAAAKRTKKDENMLAHDFYLTETWGKAYAESIHPCGDLDRLDLPEGVIVYVCGPPKTKKTSGRPPKKRKRGAGEYGVPG